MTTQKRHWQLPPRYTSAHTTPSRVFMSSNVTAKGERPHQIALSETAVVTVIVLFAPSDDDLASLRRLAGWGHPVVAVVNSCDAKLSGHLPEDPAIRYILNDDNAGLARALNQGVDTAIAAGAAYVLLLDQDSRPDRTMGSRLVEAAAACAASGRRLACAAPKLIDRKLMDASVGPIAGVQPTRSTLATSGTLITRSGWAGVGQMWDELFIDGIDHEWCFRARSRGFETVTAENVVMMHNMGDDAINFFGRFKPVHRSPTRHYFIVRNTLWLARRRYIPLGWRLSESAKCLYRIPAYVAFSTNRVKTVRNLLRAVVDGMRRPSDVVAARYG